MTQIDLIHSFLAKQKIAVVGVSRKGDLPANAIYKKLKNNGYKVWQVNPNATEIGGEPCYKNLSELPEPPEAVMLAGTPETSAAVAKEILETPVKSIWMHRGIGEGSYSEEARDILTNKGLQVITQGCPMMFVKPVDPFHKILRWFKKF